MLCAFLPCSWPDITGQSEEGDFCNINFTFFLSIKLPLDVNLTNVLTAHLKVHYTERAFVFRVVHFFFLLFSLLTNCNMVYVQDAKGYLVTLFLALPRSEGHLQHRFLFPPPPHPWPFICALDDSVRVCVILFFFSPSLSIPV